MKLTIGVFIAVLATSTIARDRHSDRDYEPRYGVKQDPQYDPALVEDWDPAYPRYIPDYSLDLSDDDHDSHDHKERDKHDKRDFKGNKTRKH